MSKRGFLFVMDDNQIERLRNGSVVTGVCMSELLRRMIDYCLQDDVICNLVVPFMSGRISVGG